MRFSEVDYKTDDVNSLDELSSKTTTIPSDPFPLGFEIPSGSKSFSLGNF